MNAKPPRRQGKSTQKDRTRISSFFSLGLSFLASWRLGVPFIIFFLAHDTLGAALDGFRESQPFNEQIRETRIDTVRIVTVASRSFDPAKPTLLIIYALPNGNSIEQTIGC